MQVKNGQELRLLAVLVSGVRDSHLRATRYGGQALFAEVGPWLPTRIDRKTGALTQTDAKLDSPAPMCIAFV
jgi:hypothetical protein